MTKYHWVLLRGLVRETRHWGPFAQQLENYSDGVSLLELPGIGQKSDIAAPHSIEKYVDNLRQDYLKITSPTPKALLAVSLGGMIAQNWIHRYPQDFHHAVIVNSSSGNLSPIHHRLSLNAIKMIGRFFLNNDVKKRELAILKMTTQMLELSPEILDQWYEVAKEHPISRFSFLAQLNAARKFKTPDHLNIPVLFLASLKDKFVNYSCSFDLARHYQTSVKAHPEAGHDLALDDPQWLLDKMMSFSDECTLENQKSSQSEFSI